MAVADLLRNRPSDVGPDPGQADVATPVTPRAAPGAITLTRPIPQRNAAATFGSPGRSAE